jgi:hypothetical protein
MHRGFKLNNSRIHGPTTSLYLTLGFFPHIHTLDHDAALFRQYTHNLALHPFIMSLNYLDFITAF